MGLIFESHESSDRTPADLERLRRSSFEPGRWALWQAGQTWRPPTDVFETNDAVIVRVEIAGMRTRKAVDFAAGYAVVCKDVKGSSYRPDKRPTHSPSRRLTARAWGRSCMQDLYLTRFRTPRVEVFFLPRRIQEEPMSAQTIMWLGFAVVIAIMFVLDLGVFNRKSHAIGFREALTWTFVWVSLAMAFDIWIYLSMGPTKALEFFTGYLIEESLSVDNLFVFIMIFSYFHVSRAHQPKILKWGIADKGLYRIIRHPQYLALGIWGVGMSILWPRFLVLASLRVPTDMNKTTVKIDILPPEFKQFPTPHSSE